MHRLALLALLFLSLSPAARAQWETIPNPDTRQGLVIQPRLLTVRGRLHLFYANTFNKAPNPELTMTDRTDTEDWKAPRSMYFGADLGTVRKLAAATARDEQALIFMRTSAQGGGALELHLSISNDGCYSFPEEPLLIDSFVADVDYGTYVSMAARQGTKRGEFVAAWVAEGGNVRVAAVDLRTGFRPDTATVGTVPDFFGHVEVTAAGAEGFYACWPEAHCLKSVHIKPLTGGAEKAQVVLNGDYQRDFCMASYYKGPAYLVAADESGHLQSLVEGDGKWQKQDETQLTFQGKKMECRCVLDGDRKLHVAILNPDHSNKIYYLTNRTGQWTQELAMDLDPTLNCTGFDIAVTDGYAYIVAAQNQKMQCKRKKLN